MTKLHEVIAARTARQKALLDECIALANTAKKKELFTGLTKSFDRADEDGTQYPPEEQHVRQRAEEVINDGKVALSTLADLVLTNDVGNTMASAAIVIDGTALTKEVPVTTLMYLEKWIGHLRDFVRALPTTDTVNEWTWSADRGVYESAEKQRVKTRKEQVPVVMYDATPEHPAQVELVGRDVVEGFWKERLFSSALSPEAKRSMLESVEALNVAVRQARERANAQEVEAKEIGASLLGFVFKNGSQ